jgi:hypothetical protein
MQFNPVVLKDGAAANHTFAPRDITNGVATFVESTGVPIADKRLSVSQSRVAATGRTKVTMKLVVPIVQDAIVNGITRPTVVRTAYADLTFTVDATSSLADRKDLRTFLDTALTSTMGVAVVDGLETLY